MKNNKGFFLAEAIIMIALVTTVMAFVYPNVAKLYENFELKVKYYDQTEDLYNLKAIYQANKVAIDNKTIDNCSSTPNVLGAKEFNDSMMTIIDSSVASDILNGEVGSGKTFSMYNSITIYLTGYMSSLTDSSNSNFNKYLKRLKKTTNDNGSYRLIADFELTDNTHHYASIKIENPNPNRGCNL